MVFTNALKKIAVGFEELIKEVGSLLFFLPLDSGKAISERGEDPPSLHELIHAGSLNPRHLQRTNTLPL
jgi:hypothetical protein